VLTLILKNSCSLIYTHSLKRCYIVVKFGETFVSLALTPLTAQKSFENEISRIKNRVKFHDFNVSFYCLQHCVVPLC